MITAENARNARTRIDGRVRFRRRSQRCARLLPTSGERTRKKGLHARPHPGPLPQERGRRSRRLWKTTRPGVGARSGGRAGTRRTQPRLSSFQTGQREVRPHPGPLPQERGRRSRRLWKTTSPGVGAPSGRKGSNATDATEAIELSNSARKFSLSLGERAGVRASLPLTRNRSNHRRRRGLRRLSYDPGKSRQRANLSRRNPAERNRVRLRRSLSAPTPTGLRRKAQGWRGANPG